MILMMEMVVMETMVETVVMTMVTMVGVEPEECINPMPQGRSMCRLMMKNR
jgi:hypothetical protein